MISQQQSQRQHLKILPQQIQLLNLYFLNNLELEQRMKTEMEENPFLEMTEEEAFESTDERSKESEQDFEDWEERGYDDVPDYSAEYQNYFNGEQMPQMPIASKRHYKDDAKEQLHHMELSSEDRVVGEYLIDVLDNHGLMEKDLDEVADDLSFHIGAMVEVSTITRILEIIKTLEPIGIGCRSVQENLELQLATRDHDDEETFLAYRLIKDHYNDLMHRQFEKVQHSLSIDEEQLRSILNLISTLKFYPVSENISSFEPKTTIVPDFIITRHADTTQVHLYTQKSNNVYINQGLYDQLSTQTNNKGRDRGASQYIKSKLASAQWFVNAVKQREDTMMRIMKAIVNFQEEFFVEGNIRSLKPMVLRMVAEDSGMDISTVSRITSNKYAETHFGIVYLKDLFSEGIADKKGKVISNKVIQSVIQEAIGAENKKKPYTDQQLVNILAEKGYNIARRTVAKYREQLKIPIAQIRAVWA